MGLQDSTALKRKETELAYTQQFLKKIIDAVPDLIFVKDEQLRITLANKAFLGMYPDPDKVIGHTTLEDYPLDEVKKFTEQDRIAFEKGHTETYEDVTFPGEGLRNLYTKKVSFKNATGEKFLLGITRDVTELVQAKNKLIESQERFDLAVKASLSGVWDWSIKTGALFCSERFKEILETQDVEMDYDALESRIHEDDKSIYLMALSKHLHNKEPFDAEYRLRKECGAYVWVHTRGQALWDDQQMATRMLGTITDISDKKAYQDEIHEYLNALIENNQDLDDFAHIVAHDLKEPLRGISAYSQILKEDYVDTLDHEGAEKLHTLTKLTAKIENLLDALSSYSYIGRTQLNCHKIHLGKIIEDAFKTSQYIAHSSNANIQVQEELPEIMCDPEMLSEVYVNLLTNALKYNDHDVKKIEIGYLTPEQSDHNDQGTFYVKDNGIGIDKAYRLKIFDIFQRLHLADAYGGGTGSGLTIVKKIIVRHKGRIWIEDNEWGGTTFCFTLPQQNYANI